MDFKNISDKELLNHLMLSEFNEYDITSDDFVFLLKKFRTYYRIKYLSYEKLKGDTTFIIDKQSNKIEELNKKLIDLENQISEKNKVLNSIYNRRLSFIERLTGKLKIFRK